MIHKIFKRIAGGGALAALLFLVTADAAQNPPLNSQTSSPRGSVVIPGIPTQGENFLRESLNVIPDDLNEFSVGGGSVILPPAGGYRFQFGPNPGVRVPPLLSCGGLNIGVSLTSSLNSVTEGAMGALRAVQEGITAVISGLPMLAIAYISPTIYEVLTEGIGASLSEFFQLDIPSCEDLKRRADDLAASGGMGGGLVEDLASGARGYINDGTAWVGPQAQTVSAGIHEGFGMAQEQIDSLSGRQVRTRVEQRAAERSTEGEAVAQSDGTTTMVAGTGQAPMTAAIVLEPVVRHVLRAHGPGSTLKLLAGKSPTEPLTNEEASGTLIDMLEQVIGRTSVRQVANPNGGPAAIDARTTGGAGVGVIYNQYQTDISQSLAQVITNIKERPDLNATAEDVRQIARDTGGYMLTPQSLKVMAKGTFPPGDGAILRMEAALISALTYRKMVMWLMEEKGLLTILGTGAGSAGPLQTAMINRITTAFSSIWSGDEMSLRRELMWAEKNVAEAMTAITDLEERRREKTRVPLID